MMQRVLTSEKLPIKLWLDDPEPGALEQARNLANLPFAFHHVALLPDCHQGYGMPIGAVLATRNVVVPNAVGVDIGCGMCAMKTDLHRIERDRLQALLNRVKARIPVGFEWHATPQDAKRMPERKSKDAMPVVWQQYERALHQVGTLGGGNHFIEIQHGSDGLIWLMIHSGSRNLGKQIADRYNRIAIEFDKKSGSPVPPAWQLASLPIDTPEARQYWNEMEYCVAFARANRQWMMEQIRTALTEIFPRVAFEPTIDIAHNYAARENHFNQDVIVHRKGATAARKGQLGIIPGSQGAPSYLVKGKGHPESFESCSHGAGRQLGRKQAMRTLCLEEQQALMNGKGILHSIVSVNDLDEAPGAYKDIDVVMKNQSDLVDIVVAFTPLAVLKGTGKRRGRPKRQPKRGKGV